jgi:AraC family transcriptional activator of pobA
MASGMHGSGKPPSMLPIYNSIDPGSFSIQLLETATEDTLRTAAAIHRHRTPEVVFLIEGSAGYQVDGETYVLGPGHLCLIRAGKMHALNFHPGAKGYVLSFAPDFFCVPMDRSLMLNGSMFGFSNGCPLEVAGPMKTEIIKMVRTMLLEFHHTWLFTAEVLKGLLRIFFIYLSRLADVQPQPHFSRKNQIVEQFLTLLEEKFATHRRPADYAEALSLTTSYLNETVKTVSGFTTSYHIHQRVILEAKRLAVYSDHSMKQVAYSLGFDDVCHFSRFFKKTCGQGFTAFKQKTLIGVM